MGMIAGFLLVPIAAVPLIEMHSPYEITQLILAGETLCVLALYLPVFLFTGLATAVFPFLLATVPFIRSTLNAPA